MHYSRWERYGDPNARRGLANGDALEVFQRLAFVETDACVIWPHAHDIHGYGTVTWEGRRRKTHQLALELRDPSRLGRGACHIPGIGCSRDCMNYRHLYWGTQAENAADQLVDGTGNQGEQCGMARLTAPQVVEIRQRHANGETCVSLGVEFGVASQHVGRIVRRERWAHIP